MKVNNPVYADMGEIIAKLDALIGQVSSLESSLGSSIVAINDSLVNDFVLPSFNTADAHSIIFGVNKAADKIVYLGHFIPAKKGRYVIKFEAVGSVGSGCGFHIAMDLPLPDSNNAGIVDPGKTWLLDVAPGTVLSTIINFDTPSFVSTRPIATNKTEQPVYPVVVEAGRPLAFWASGTGAISGIKVDILYKEVY